MNNEHAKLSSKKWGQVSEQMYRHSTPKQRCSPQGTSKRQNKNIESVEKFAGDATDYKDRLLSGEQEYATYVGSAACEWIHLRTKIAMVALLAKPLIQALEGGVPTYFVTTGNPLHRRDTGKLFDIETSTVLETTQSFDYEMGAVNPNYKSITVLEVNQKLELDGKLQFQPHLHKIVTDVDEAIIRKKLEIRPTYDDSTNRSVHVTRIKTAGAIIRCLLYMSKSCPEIKTVYRDKKNNKNSRSNRMQNDARGEWASWYAQYTIDEIVQFEGFSDKTIEQYEQAEMKQLAKKFIKICRKTPTLGELERIWMNR